MIRTTATKIAMFSISAVALSALSVPVIVYWLGLANIQGRPERPNLPHNIAADNSLLKQAFHSDGPIAIRVISPWGCAASFFSMCANGLRVDNGSKAIGLIVGKYESTHLRNQGMSYWHLSSAALSIWLSRNWSTDEVVVAAAEIVRSSFPAYSSSSLLLVPSVSGLPARLASVVGYHWKCCGMVDVGEEFQPTDVIGGPDKRFIMAGVGKHSALIAYDWGNGWEYGVAAAAYVYTPPDWHLVARWNLDGRPNSLPQLILQTDRLPLGITEGHYFVEEPDFDHTQLYLGK